MENTRLCGLSILALAGLHFLVCGDASARGLLIQFPSSAGSIAAKAQATPTIDAAFVQVYPRSETDAMQRSTGQRRAVVLIHGLRVQMLRTNGTAKARLHGWQRADSRLVRAFSPHADVFSFAYSQNVPVEEIAALPCLADGIEKLRSMRYSEIVVIGHSAGGLVARQFVEDYPEAGVTKVIQICTPNAGASLAKLQLAAPTNHRSFLSSLTKDARARWLAGREHKSIPAGVEFICVVGCGAAFGDGIVSVNSQWPTDLRTQGVMAHALMTTHYTVMRSPIEISQIIKLTCGPSFSSANRFAAMAILNLVSNFPSAMHR